jgi:hypothetical protein
MVGLVGRPGLYQIALATPARLDRPHGSIAGGVLRGLQAHRGLTDAALCAYLAGLAWLYGETVMEQVGTLAPLEMVDQNIVSWNPLMCWLRNVEALQSAA